MNKKLCIILFFSLLSPLLLKAQSVIYKKDRTQVKVTQISKADKIISCKFTDDPDGNIHYISISAIDSIRNEDGQVEKFETDSVFFKPDIPEKIRKNAIGIDVGAVLISGAAIFYERYIAGNSLTLKNYLYMNFKPGRHSVNHYGSASLLTEADFYISPGFKYYFLKSRIFRFGTGISYLIGRNRVYKYDPRQSFFHKTIKSGIIFNGSIHWIPDGKFEIAGGWNVPLRRKNFPETFPTFPTLEISYKF